MSTPQLIDTHCHIDLQRHFPEFESILQEAREAGVSDIVLAGVIRSGWSRMLNLSERYPGVYAAPGLHPMYLRCHSEDDLHALSQLVQRINVVAIGEIGLDYFCNVDRHDQQQLFEGQLDIAAEFRLPVLLHVRKAHDQVLATLRRKRFAKGGIVHAFNGSMQQAEQYIKLGFMLSVCGTVTFERSRKIRRVVAALPLETLVLETDSPDIAPASRNGGVNRPAYLPEILLELASLRSEGVDEIASVTSNNARNVLRLTASQEQS